MRPDARLPVHVLTGFLGSGKTTLLNRWLQSPLLRETAVLINEFGEVGLDHHLVQTLDDAPVLLANGCVCCAIRGDLKAALLRLQDQRQAGEIPAYRRVLLETTGVADPAPILATLLHDSELRHHVRPGRIITTVDVLHGLTSLERHREVAQQIALADVIVLTKTDLSDGAAMQRISGVLRGLSPGAVLHEAPLAGAGLIEGGEDPDSRDDRPMGDEACPFTEHTHTAPYRALSLVLDEPLDWTAFGVWLSMLLHVHGTRVLRVKGLLHLTDGRPPVVINGVQHLVHPPYHLASWPHRDRRSRLVFITEGLDEQRLLESLRVFGRVAARIRLGVDSAP